MKLRVRFEALGPICEQWYARFVGRWRQAGRALELALTHDKTSVIHRPLGVMLLLERGLAYHLSATQQKLRAANLPLISVLEQRWFPEA